MCACRVEYLSKFSPPPSSSTASFGGALTERMAGRILLFFMRHASLLRPLSQAGKLQLAKVSRLHFLYQGFWVLGCMGDMENF